MDAITMLTEQHHQVDSLFDEVAGAAGEHKREVFMELADMLALHAALEERHFYPAVRDSLTEELVIDSFEEHFEMKGLLTELLQSDAQDEAFDEKVDELRLQVLRHVRDEEEELFPRARTLLGEEGLQTVALQMVTTMVELADTEPRNDIPSHELSHPGP